MNPDVFHRLQSQTWFLWREYVQMAVHAIAEADRLNRDRRVEFEYQHLAHRRKADVVIGRTAACGGLSHAQAAGIPVEEIIEIREGIGGKRRADEVREIARGRRNRDSAAIDIVERE